ncbi:MAG: SipW-dependent-type signal peptide-containing protein [Dethiobacter sp.]|jgi:predicted ribosomally synthesized peptide with SipW-like signal peptide|nr:SipW-dependent-type signal peptide-containing protein [Dethiobacter sp.]MBS3983025.1 SipW-dependent-type signal peptide-containing protein [Dethiobacter sp.]
MKSKMFMSMMVIALAAALVGGATMAWFTSQATNPANTFSAGTLIVGAGSQTYAVPIGNMAPGDVISGSFLVSNAGTLDLKYMTTAATTGALFGAGGASVAFTANDTGTIAAGGPAVTVSYTVTLPTTAGNAFQGNTGTLAFTVDATQPANPGWTQ